MLANWVHWALEKRAGVWLADARAEVAGKRWTDPPNWALPQARCLEHNH